MSNPELDAGESEAPIGLRQREESSIALSSYPTGRIKIEEVLDTFSCIQCNAGLVIALFAVMMHIIRNKENNTPMSRVPTSSGLNWMLTEGVLMATAGFLIMCSLGLFQKLWNNTVFNIDVLRPGALIIAAVLTFVSFILRIVRTIQQAKSDDQVDNVPNVTLVPMCIIFCMFYLVILAMAMKVMIFNNFAFGFISDNTAVFKNKRHQSEMTIPGQQ